MSNGMNEKGQPMNDLDMSQYRKDARGALVPVAAIKEVDLLRDDLVRELVAKVLPVKAELATLKREAMAEANAFIDMSVEQYGVKRSVKGNTTLHSFDGKYRILIANHDVLQFDERIQAAKALIDECLDDYTKDANVNLKAIVQKAFNVNAEGKINVKRVLELRTLKIEDEKWQRAMQALSDSLNVQTSREYIRFYERNDETGEYELINLDFAKV
jgi:hypothetical protein